MKTPYYTFVGLLLSLLFSCSKEKETLFSELDPDDTGIRFRNDLVETTEKNVLSYIYIFTTGAEWRPAI